jgi:hypothetical protein
MQSSGLQSICIRSRREPANSTASLRDRSKCRLDTRLRTKDSFLDLDEMVRDVEEL